MSLKELLKKKESAIVGQWFDSVVNTYQIDTSRFLKSQKDAFANPVGNSLSQGLSVLARAVFDEISGRMDSETVISFLDPIIRIRALQDFSASKAVGFVFFLKKIVREQTAKEIGEDKTLQADMLLFESRIDELALIAFDIYMQCREKIYEIKANEVKNRTFSAFHRAGLVADWEEEPGK
ncbi:MAG: hypothetical protein BWK80_12965 [Desulfobacteraceae bacterium IS3]|nr:MAG: hypothetical protein BWK80_12965 [Desulfobacteraceae bacterium IS3]